MTTMQKITRYRLTSESVPLTCKINNSIITAAQLLCSDSVVWLMNSCVRSALRVNVRHTFRDVGYMQDAC